MEDQISVQFLADSLNDSLNRMDELRAAGLNQVTQFITRNNATQIREYKRLAEKLGEADERTKKMKARVDFNAFFEKNLNKEVERINLSFTKLEPDTWRVHGRVYDADGTPQQNMTVFLSDGKRNWIKDFGFSCTDERGYFSIIADEQLIRCKKGEALFISVSNNQQQIVHVDKQALYAEKNKSDFRDIVLSGEICVPPPSEDKKGGCNSIFKNLPFIKKNI